MTQTKKCQTPCYWATSSNNNIFLVPKTLLSSKNKEVLIPCYLTSTPIASKDKIRIAKVVRMNKLELNVIFQKIVYMDIIDEDETKLEIVDKTMLKFLSMFSNRYLILQLQNVFCLESEYVFRIRKPTFNHLKPLTMIRIQLWADFEYNKYGLHSSHYTVCTYLDILTTTQLLNVLYNESEGQLNKKEVLFRYKDKLITWKINIRPFITKANDCNIKFYINEYYD